MKAAYINRTGPAAETIEYGDLPKPAVPPRHALIKVHAVSVNPIDTYIRNGANYWPLPFPFVVGSDMAGVVEESMSGSISVGDRVWVTNQGFQGRQGVFAEYAVVHEDWIFPLPNEVDFQTAAACALVGITAHLGLFREANLKNGETILINGGSGGVGLMVVQMAKAVGARVLITAGSNEKMAIAKNFGVDAAFNYNSPTLEAEIKEAAPHGVNVFWETTREPNFDVIVPRMAERGRIVLMAGRDARPVFPVGPFYVKECSLHGFVMFKASSAEMKLCAKDMNEWMRKGQLRAHIGARFKLSQTAEAHALQEQKTIQRQAPLSGKIVLTPDDT